MNRANRLTRAAAVALAIALSGPALAQSIVEVPVEQVVRTFGDIEVVSPWTRATMPGQVVAGGYLGLRNRSDKEITLVSAETPLATRVDQHQMTFSKGFPEMSKTPGPIPIPPHGETILKPGGLHLMMMGMKQRLQVGKTYPLTLTFSDGTVATVDMIVWDVGTVYGKQDYQ